jgi:hypothetical protein
MFARTKYPLSSNSQKRQCIAPGSVSRRSELNSHFSIAIGIARDTPLEAQIEQGRVFDSKSTCDGGVLGVCNAASDESETEETNESMHCIFGRQIKHAQSLVEVSLP